MLPAIFRIPTQSGIAFGDIEGLALAAGGEVREGKGSHAVFELGGSRRYPHRPHPGKEARKYQIEELREWFVAPGITP